MAENWEREYAPTSDESWKDNGYPLYDSIIGSYYKEVPIEVNPTEKTTRVVENEYRAASSPVFRNNPVASIFKGLAIFVWVLAGIIGLICFLRSWLIGRSALGSGFIIGLFLYALAEIIQLLEDIKNK